jgi:hypothetical protein
MKKTCILHKTKGYNWSNTPPYAVYLTNVFHRTWLGDGKNIDLASVYQGIIYTLAKDGRIAPLEILNSFNESSSCWKYALVESY